MTVFCFLDVFCLMPHPIGLTEKAEMPDIEGINSEHFFNARSDSPIENKVDELEPSVTIDADQKGASSSNARTIYLNLVQAMQTEVARLQSAAEKQHQKSICNLAAYVVTERARARVKVRLMGSALMHSLLIVRDVFKYGDKTFTLEAMKYRQRRHLQDSGNHHRVQDTEIPDALVCEAVVRSSVRTNEGYTRVANSSSSYTMETLGLYILVTTILGIVVFISTTAMTTLVGWCRCR